MRRRIASLAALLVTVALGVLVASAAALTPPPGTPDLAKMVIQPSDLAAGAKPSVLGYASAPKNFAALYESRYASASTSAGVRLLGLDTEVLLGDSEPVATGFFALERGLYRSSVGRSSLAKEIEGAAGKKGVTIKQVQFGEFRALGVGTQSFLQPLTLKVGSVHAAADFVVMRIGAVVADVTVVLIDPKRALSVARTLGGDVAAHVAAVLGATGSTGATGTTAATGTTGATG